jgi:hypothetical protein
MHIHLTHHQASTPLLNIVPQQGVITTLGASIAHQLSAHPPSTTPSPAVSSIPTRLTTLPEFTRLTIPIPRTPQPNPGTATTTVPIRSPASIAQMTTMETTGEYKWHRTFSHWSC